MVFAPGRLGSRTMDVEFKEMGMKPFLKKSKVEEMNSEPKTDQLALKNSTGKQWSRRSIGWHLYKTTINRLQREGKRH